MHADLYVQLVDQLLAEVMVTRDLEQRGSLLRQAQEWHDKAVIAADGGMVPTIEAPAARTMGDGSAELSGQSARRLTP
jgi:hypothetical protein